MRRFSLIEFANKTEQVLDAAIDAPVAILSGGQPRFVVMSLEKFEELTRFQDMRPDRED